VGANVVVVVDGGTPVVVVVPHVAGWWRGL
jgi:hypothetical protein